MPVNLTEIPQKLRMGLEGVLLDHTAETLHQNRNDVAAYRAMQMTDQNGTPAPKPTGGKPMVILGDVTINEKPEAAPAQPPAEKPSDDKPATSPLSRLARIALIASPLLGLGGVGAGLLALLNRPEAPPPQVIERETTNDYRIGTPVVE